MGFLYSQLFVTPAVPRSDLTGQTIIVTGANVGLGLEAARLFAQLNASKVILACRDVSKGKAAATSVLGSTRVPESRLEVWQLDLSSYKSVKAFADRAAALPRLDAVVENAGIVTKHFKMMEDDESTITVNLVSTILLGLLLLPKLRESAKANKKDGRLVFVGSEVYMWAKFTEKNSRGNIFDTLDSHQTANMSDRYNVSKLLLLMAVREFAKAAPVSSESPVIISILTPGFCKSTIFRDGGFGAALMNFMANLIGRETEVGSRTLVDAACPVHGRDTHGCFLWDCKVTQPKSGYIVSREGRAMQQKLWKELMEKLEDIAPGVSRNL